MSDNFVDQLARLCLTFLTLAAMALVAWLLHLCGAGIDFSDEGYYLNWIAHPELYPVSPTQFGFVYGPLYDLLGRKLILLRQANLLLTLGAGWFFFGLLVLDQRRPTGRERVAWIALAFVLSVSALTVLYLWQPTPSYNTLTLQALLLGGGALCLIRRDQTNQWAGGYLLLGLAGALAFLAKPTSAGAAAVLFLSCLAVRRQLAWRNLLAGAVACLLALVVAAWAIDGSVRGFADRLANAAIDTQKLQSNYSFWQVVRLDTFDLTRPQNQFLWAGTALLAATSWCATSGVPWLRLFASGFVLATSVAFSAVVVYCHLRCHSLLDLYGYDLGPFFSYIPSGDWVRRFPNGGVLLLVWPAAAAAVALARFHQRRAWAELGIAVCFLFLPYAYVIGTSVNYWQAMGGAGAFWCAAGVVFLSTATSLDQRWTPQLPLAAAALVGTALLVMPAIEAPYRQRQPLRLNGQTVVLTQGDRLKLPQDTATYVRQIRTLLESHGFRSGDPLLDLSGHYPGLVYLVDGRAVGLAWMLGGYPGSEAFVRQGLSRVPPATLRGAWLLTEPDGPRALAPGILQHFGIDLARDFEEIGIIDSPVAEYSRSYRQHLYKPKSRTNRR